MITFIELISSLRLVKRAVGQEITLPATSFLVNLFNLSVFHSFNVSIKTEEFIALGRYRHNL